MKRLLSLLLALALVLGTSCALAYERGEYEKAPETVVVTTATSLDATRQFDESDPDKRSMTENRWVSTFKDVLNVDLQYKWVTTDGDSSSAKWSTAIASGDLPDFARIGDNTYQQLLDSGMIADCTEAWNEYICDEYKALLDESSIAQVTFDGKMRGFPFPNKGYMGAKMLFVRQDWLDKLGLDYPRTLDEVVAVARAFQEAKLGGDDTMALMVSTVDDGHISGLMNVLGAYYDYWVEDENGKITWSNIQPAMRDALLTLQGLYKEGVINEDFAIVTSDLAKEYIAGGKTGIFYATSWDTTMSIQALYDNDENAHIISDYIHGADGSEVRFQTNTPVVGKIFINPNCTPEQIKMIAQMLNLSFDLTNSPDLETYQTYSIGPDGHMWFKYLPFGDKPVSTINDMASADEIRRAYQAGAKTSADWQWEYTDAKGWYDTYVDALNGGSSPDWYYLTFGEGGTYTQLYDAYQLGLHLSNAYVGLPTATQQMMGDVINDQLKTAMLEVIMGADVSVYDNAVNVWLSSGGQMIIDEINEAMGK